VQLHLLSLLHYILRDADLRRTLAAQPGRDKIVGAIRDAEARIGA
jgi:hypothetical protein